MHLFGLTVLIYDPGGRNMLQINTFLLATLFKILFCVQIGNVSAVHDALQNNQSHLIITTSL